MNKELENMTQKKLLSLEYEQAREFFLRGSSYTNIDLPIYFKFDEYLGTANDHFQKEYKEFFIAEVLKILKKSSTPNMGESLNTTKVIPNEFIQSICDQGYSFESKFPIHELKKIYNVIYDYKGQLFPEGNVGHYTIYGNKDGDLSWRNYQLLHPFFYVLLVNVLTLEHNWEKLKERFQGFQSNESIVCTSIPIFSSCGQGQRKKQIMNWWEEVEQKSVLLALEYEYMHETDISDCYPSIYTHAIAWAIEGKDVAKQDRGYWLLGNQVDKIIQFFQNGQTNGIPQGSILMDFIAEIVLGYIDFELTEQLNKDGINNSQYKILRYRDDYKIFSNDSTIGHRVLSILAKVLLPYGMKLNSSKTNGYDEIILNSIKKDKLSWLNKKWLDIKNNKNFQEYALLILMHSKNHPNSGSLVKALSEYSRDIRKEKRVSFPMQIISIITDIGFANPRTIPVCCTIISFVSTKLDAKDQKEIIRKVVEKLKKVSYSSMHEIWIQRLVKSFDVTVNYDEDLCKLVEGQISKLWDIGCIKEGFSDTKYWLNQVSIFDLETYNSLDKVIEETEYNIFSQVFS